MREIENCETAVIGQPQMVPYPSVECYAATYTMICVAQDRTITGTLHTSIMQVSKQKHLGKMGAGLRLQVYMACLRSHCPCVSNTCVCAHRLVSALTGAGSTSHSKCLFLLIYALRIFMRSQPLLQRGGANMGLFHGPIWACLGSSF